MSYKGNASFEYEIERMKDSEGNLYSDDDEAPEGCTYVCIPLKIMGNSYYQEGRTHGLPENCYPDEGSTEIDSVIGPDGKDWYSALTQSEHDKILDQITSEVENQDDYCDRDDYIDDRDDDYYDYAPDAYDC